MSSNSSDSESSLGMNNETPSGDNTMRSAHEEPPATGPGYAPHPNRDNQRAPYLSFQNPPQSIPPPYRPLPFPTRSDAAVNQEPPQSAPRNTQVIPKSLDQNLFPLPSPLPYTSLSTNQYSLPPPIQGPYLPFQNPPQNIPQPYQPLPIPTRSDAAVNPEPPQSAPLNTQVIPKTLAQNLLPLPPPPYTSSSTNQYSFPPPIQKQPSNDLSNIKPNFHPPPILQKLPPNAAPIIDQDSLPIHSMLPSGHTSSKTTRNFIKGPGNPDFDAPPVENQIENSTAIKLKRKVTVIDIEGFVDHQIIDFEYKAKCCSKVSSLPLKEKILQLKKNVNLNGESVSLLRQRLNSVNINITGPYNVIDLSILIHCLKFQRFETKALRVVDRVDELYRVVIKSSDYLIQNLDQIWEGSSKWKEMKNSFKPIICLTSGLVLKAIKNNKGDEIQEKEFDDQSKSFLKDPDTFWAEI